MKQISKPIEDIEDLDEEMPNMSDQVKKQLKEFFKQQISEEGGKEMKSESKEEEITAEQPSLSKFDVSQTQKV